MVTRAKVRILVLTSSTGGGHDARAEAFAEWVFALYRHAVDVRIEHMLERSSVVHRSGVGTYNWIQKRAPFLHVAFYTIVEGLSYLNRRTVTLGRGYYQRILRTYRPHLVFSVHDCLNRGYFQLARQELGDQVRCATYCGEFSGGWGYSRNWIEPTVDLYISRTATAGELAVKRGIARERHRVRGHFMRPRSYTEVIKPEDRGAHRVDELGLEPDRFTVFLATGGNGANNHFDLLPHLLPLADRVQVIAICGRNAEAYHQLLAWRTEYPELPLYVEGFSDHVHLHLQVSDVIVTRGGTTTCAKALHFGCPILFNTFGGIMPQERLTVKFFRQNAGAEIIASPEDFGRVLDRWMVDPASYQRYRAAFIAQRHDEDPRVVIDELVELAQSAAGVRVARQQFRLAHEGRCRGRSAGGGGGR